MCEAGEMCEEYAMVLRLVSKIADSYLEGNIDVQLNDLGELECFAAIEIYSELKAAVEYILSHPPPSE